jgi:hypothetical protein
MTNAVNLFVDETGNSTLLRSNFTRCDGRSAVFPFLVNFSALGTRGYKADSTIIPFHLRALTVLLEAMEQSSHHITDLDLRTSPGPGTKTNLLARSLKQHVAEPQTPLSFF